MIIWLFLRREPSFGWFALSCVLWLLFISHFLTTETFPYPSVLVASQANLSFFILYVLAFSLYLIRFVNQRFPILEESIFILSLAVIGCVFLTPLDYVKLVFGIVFLSYASLLVLVYFYLAYLTYKSRKTEVYLLLFCLTLIGFFAGVDVFRLSNAATASLYQPLSPYTSPVITLFIAIILGMRLKRNIQKIEKFNQDLELKVFEVSDDLKRSMSEKHYLELENVRLQERIHLSHDLHDGLGASLVRSMIMVDQSEQNMSNQQFLSMLKLLRDDLRQIIDSGSSIGSKVPENPKIWVAPVRHRFSQLMDEMDIHSKWDFPNEWVIEPNSLQCLTLMRVLEESLTNVIKHSQAKHVSVSMQFVPPKQLVLKVQDDGVGFQANSVLEHGMSIGIRSMQMRLERVGGQLKLNSTPGYTLIQAVLTLDPAHLNSPR
ncbi:ATP-binding protein [Acinetobacter sp. NS4_7]